jgi:Fic family protein
MPWTIPSMEPLLPESRRPELQDLAWTLGGEAAQLMGALNAPSRAAVAQLLRIVNSYYSNLIEGHATLPADIERAYRRDYSNDPGQRDLQLEAKAHVEVERRMRLRLEADDRARAKGIATARITEPRYLQWLHDCFFRHLPPTMWGVTSPSGRRRTVVPGTLRTDEVTVGAHDPPDAADLPAFLQRFDDVYRPDRLSGADRVIAAAASHHRLLWIHPFLDGNGRVVRLFTESYLIAAGVDSGGLWSVARGLSRRSAEYKQLLAAADDQRHHATDGRGNLSDSALAAFCVFFLEQGIDQVRFIRGLLDIGHLQDRVMSYLDAQVAKGHLPASSPSLVLQALLRGRLERGDALGLLGGKERTARLHLATLLNLGFLAPDGVSHKSPIRWSIPASAGTHYFPQLYPDNDGQSAVRPVVGNFIHTLRSLSLTALHHAIDAILADLTDQLPDEDSVISAMAETNATSFGVDDYHIGDVDLFDDEKARVEFSFHLTGEHGDDHFFSGDEVEGHGVLVIGPDGVGSLTDVTAQRVFDGIEDESDGFDLNPGETPKDGGNF